MITMKWQVWPQGVPRWSEGGRDAHPERPVDSARPEHRIRKKSVLPTAGRFVRAEVALHHGRHLTFSLPYGRSGGHFKIC